MCGAVEGSGDAGAKSPALEVLAPSGIGRVDSGLRCGYEPESPVEHAIAEKRNEWLACRLGRSEHGVDQRVADATTLVIRADADLAGPDDRRITDETARADDVPDHLAGLDR